MIDLKALKQFSVNADKPHAFGTAEIKSEPDGSRTIEYSEGSWSMQDNFFGGEPYGGRQVIFYENEPVWLCVYYGWVDGNAENVSQIYDFLREALQKPDESLPYRGPKKLEKGNLVYENRPEGEIDRFSGKEIILRDGKLVYEASYMGGLVDRQLRGSY